MSSLARRLATTCVGVVVASATIFISPAHASESNPFTPAQACNNDFGGRWAHVDDGHRTIESRGDHIGDVYLMYDGATAKNCVVTLRSSVGVERRIFAQLTVQGYAAVSDSGDYKYYAAVEKGALDRCVKYRGGIEAGNDVDINTGGRSTWGNCG